MKVLIFIYNFNKWLISLYVHGKNMCKADLVPKMGNLEIATLALARLHTYLSTKSLIIQWHTANYLCQCGGNLYRKGNGNRCCFCRQIFIIESQYSEGEIEICGWISVLIHAYNKISVILRHLNTVNINNFGLSDFWKFFNVLIFIAIKFNFHFMHSPKTGCWELFLNLLLYVYIIIASKTNIMRNFMHFANPQFRSVCENHRQSREK